MCRVNAGYCVAIQSVVKTKTLSYTDSVEAGNINYENCDLFEKASES